MAVSVIVTTVDPIEVTEPKSSRWPVGIVISGGVSIYLTEAQATKLCFDLLTRVPPIEIARQVETLDLDYRITQ